MTDQPSHVARLLESNRRLTEELEETRLELEAARLSDEGARRDLNEVLWLHAEASFWLALDRDEHESADALDRFHRRAVHAETQLQVAKREIDRLHRVVEFEANGHTGPALEPPTSDDAQHRALAEVAVEHATRATAPDADANDLLLTDVVQEAGLAWLMTGLLPSSLSDRDRGEICRAIVGRVAAVLVLVGWEPPARLLSPPQCSVHTEPGEEGEECSGRVVSGQASREEAAEQTVGTGYPQGSGPGHGSATPAPLSSPTVSGGGE